MFGFPRLSEICLFNKPLGWFFCIIKLELLFLRTRCKIDLYVGRLQGEGCCGVINWAGAVWTWGHEGQGLRRDSPGPSSEGWTQERQGRAEGLERKTAREGPMLVLPLSLGELEARGAPALPTGSSSCPFSCPPVILLFTPAGGCCVSPSVDWVSALKSPGAQESLRGTEKKSTSCGLRAEFRTKLPEPGSQLSLTLCNPREAIWTQVPSVLLCKV